MPKRTTGSINHPSSWLLAAAICLCPAAAQAQTGNTATGAGALSSNTTGSYNTADGYFALGNNTTGSGNIAIGSYTLRNNTGGRHNTATGRSALRSNTTGEYNTALGPFTLYSNTTGLKNTAVGANALAGITGNNNIALGYNAGSETQTGSNNIYIGNPGVSASESSVIRIGRPQHSKTFIAGIAGVPASGATVVVSSNGQLGVVASSERYKQDITALTGASEKLGQLRPVSYRYKTEPDVSHYGLIAEEVEKVMPELVVRDEEGRPESVQYLELIPLLLQERHELKGELAAQRMLIEQQAMALAALRRTLDARFAALDQGGGQSVAGLK